MKRKRPTIMDRRLDEIDQTTDLMDEYNTMMSDKFSKQRGMKP